MRAFENEFVKFNHFFAFRTILGFLKNKPDFFFKKKNNLSDLRVENELQFWFFKVSIFTRKMPTFVIEFLNFDACQSL